MKKTNIGIPAEVLAGAVWFIALSGGYVPAVILAGYVLLFEWDGKLKGNALKDVILLVSFGAFSVALGPVPEILSWLNLSLSFFGDSVNFNVLNAAVNMLLKAADIAKTLLFLSSGLRALRGGSIRVPFADMMTERCLAERD